MCWLKTISKGTDLVERWESMVTDLKGIVGLVVNADVLVAEVVMLYVWEMLAKRDMVRKRALKLPPESHSAVVETRKMLYR
jgi:hypothetical protein